MNYRGMGDYEVQAQMDYSPEPRTYKKEGASEEFLRKLDIKKMKFSVVVRVNYQLD